MSSQEMTMVRIYLSEEKAHLDKLLTLLQDVEKVKGVTVYRGIGGYGESGQLHTAKLIDLSMSLPLVVEFFDLPDIIEGIIDHLHTNIKPGHIVSWPVHVRA